DLLDEHVTPACHEVFEGADGVETEFLVRHGTQDVEDQPPRARWWPVPNRLMNRIVRSLVRVAGARTAAYSVQRLGVADVPGDEARVIVDWLSHITSQGVAGMERKGVVVPPKRFRDSDQLMLAPMAHSAPLGAGGAWPASMLVECLRFCAPLVGSSRQ